MINDPTIYVDCDYCATGEEFNLTPLAKGAWDDRDLKKNLKKRGWIIDGDLTFCTQKCYELWKNEVKE